MNPVSPLGNQSMVYDCGQNNFPNNYMLVGQPQSNNMAPTYADMRNIASPQVNKPAPTSPPLSGKFITNEDDIKPNEVPPDGSVGFFILRDLSKIIAKAWNNNGQIMTVEFIPNQKAQDVQASEKTMESFMQEINQRFDKIEKMVGKVNRPFRHNKPNKEVTNNGN